MMIKTEGFLRRVHQRLCHTDPIPAADVEQDQQIVLLSGNQRGMDGIKPVHKSEYLPWLLQIDIHIRFRIIIPDIIVNAQTGSHAVPVRIYMAGDCGSPDTLQEFPNIFSPHTISPLPFRVLPLTFHPC